MTSRCPLKAKSIKKGSSLIEIEMSTAAESLHPRSLHFGWKMSRVCGDTKSGQLPISFITLWARCCSVTIYFWREYNQKSDQSVNLYKREREKSYVFYLLCGCLFTMAWGHFLLTSWKNLIDEEGMMGGVSSCVGRLMNNDISRW